MSKKKREKKTIKPKEAIKKLKPEVQSPLFQMSKRSFLGGLLAIGAFAVCSQFANWMVGLAFAVGFLLAGGFKLDFSLRRWNYAANLLWGLLAMALTSIMPCALVDTKPKSMGWDHALLNLLCVTIVCGVVFILTAKFKLSVVLSSVGLTILAVVNGLVYQFRGNELTPMDIMSAGTAMNMAGQYKLETYENTMLYALVGMVLMLFLALSMPSFPMQSKKLRRAIALTWVMAMSVVLYVGSVDIAIRNWTNYGTKYNGYYLNFYLGVRDSVVKEPDRYSSGHVDRMAEEYAPSGEEQKDLPNVIAIMSESWADLSVVGELKTNQPVTPFLDNLHTNTIRGYALASIYGANTANSEFEFLFGHSMAFLPEGCVPYQQYVQENVTALPWVMRELGYTSIATHPYYADGWSRNRIYDELGFEESTFIEDYPQQDFLRKYITDQEMFEFVLNKLKSNDTGKPLFLFGITMQNHGGYTYEGPNYSQTIWLDRDSYEEEYKKAPQYLTCLKETDDAVQYLLRELRYYEEDTIVLMFGDHHPSLGNGFYEDLYGKEFETLDEEVLRYTIPFFIWANFDIEEAEVEGTSINYLSRYLLEAAGIDLPPYYQFLKEMEEYIPAVSAKGYYSKSQGKYLTVDEASGTEADMLNEYAIAQYNNLFDEKNRNETFFGQYLPEESDSILE